jgi:hypothetical protein
MGWILDLSIKQQLLIKEALTLVCAKYLAIEMVTPLGKNS